MTPDEVKEILRFGIHKGVGLSDNGKCLSAPGEKVIIDAGDRYVINPEYVDHIYLEWRKSKEGFKLE